ncbi:MAG: ABC transporter permease [Candidatus Aminicenantes bacterium]|nr:ABC transporter permease [Candidatus Aminicenantes bacterium]
MNVRCPRLNPPRLAEWLLRRLLPDDEEDTPTGDFEESFRLLAGSKGGGRARRWYWGQVLRLAPARLSNEIYWRMYLLGDSLKVGWRILRGHKGFAAITIFGLAVSLTVGTLALVIMTHELSYDRFHADSGRIHRVAMTITSTSTSMRKATARASTPLAPTLRTTRPEVESSVRFQRLQERLLVRLDDKAFMVDRVLVAENEIFDVFSIPFVQGSPRDALARPSTAVITRSLAQNHFNHEDPVGRTLMIAGVLPFEVTGVVADPPDNSHLKYDLLLSLEPLAQNWSMDNWGWTGFYAYVKLKPGLDPADFASRIRNIADLYVADKLRQWGEQYEFFLQPLESIHLRSHLAQEIEPPGNAVHLMILCGATILILFLAVINFVNMIIARSSTRAKEIAVRKVVGAGRSHLVRRFLTETQLMAFLALAVSLVLTAGVLPWFGELAARRFLITDVLQPVRIFGLIGLTLLVGIAAGVYPALYLSSFRPVRVLKGAERRPRGPRLGKTLVVVQFAVAVLFIIGTLVVARQIRFMKNADLGFDKDRKLVVAGNFRKSAEAVKAEFLKNPAIRGATVSWNVPGRLANTLLAKRVDGGSTAGESMAFYYIDPDFIPQYGVRIVAGRNFQKDTLTDSLHAFLLNEAAVKALGFASPEESLGQHLYEGGSGRTGAIIGVVGNFHFKGLQNVIEPLVLQWNPDYFSTLTLTLAAPDLPKTLAFIERKWAELHLGEIYSATFLDQDFDRLYGSEERFFRLFAALVVLAVTIAGLGLIGLSSVLIALRTKEVGIRKTFGASIAQVVVLLSGDFLRSVLWANGLAWPVAYGVMRAWLQRYAFRTPIVPADFILAGVLTMVIAFLAVGARTFKAASADPVETIRYE